MEGTYGVYLADALCGKVQVIRQGLYYRFVCRCQVENRSIYRLRVQFEDTMVHLGILVPVDDGFGLTTVRPAKLFPSQPVRFCLVTKLESMEGHFVPIIPEEPFAYIERLKDAYLVKKYGQNGILLKDTPLG